MPKKYNPQPFDEVILASIKRAADKIREQHNAKTLLDRRAARRWLAEQAKKAEEQDLQDELEDADLDEEE